MAGDEHATSGEGEQAAQPRVRRTRRLRLCALVAACLAMGAAPSLLHAATPASLTASVAPEGYARLVFTLPEDVTAEVRQASGIVIIAFSRPLDVAVEKLAASTPGYIAIARRDPDGSGIRFGLMQKVKINTMAAGEKLFVDLLPQGWQGLPPGLPQDVIDDLSRRAREGDRKTRQQQPAAAEPVRPTVVARVSSLPTLTRYTFELSEPVPVATHRERDTISIVFDAPLKIDIADAKAALPPLVASMDVEAGAATATIKFVLAGKVDVRTFREENAFVVDLSTVDQAERRSQPPVAAPPPRRPARSSSADPDPPQTPAAASQPAPSAPPKAASAEPPPQPAPKQPAATEPQPAASPAPAPAAQPAQPAPTPPAKDATVVVTVQRQGDTVRLVVPFAARTSGAVFRRDDTLWMVFDTAALLDVNRLRAEPDRIFRAVSVSPSGSGQVVRIKLERSRLASVATDETAWIVTLGDAVLDPTAPLSITRARTRPDEAAAVIAFDAPQHLHRLSDTESTTPLLVVTAFAPARGFLKSHDMAEFRLLPSTHGVAIEPAIDDLGVELMPERIILARKGGLALTQVSSADGTPSISTYRPVTLDAQAWGFDRQADFTERHRALMDVLSDAPDERRALARMDLARFMLAREMYPEAKGILDTVVATQRDQHELTAALVLRGLALMLLGREDLALRDFSAPNVGTQHNAALWRAIALSRQGRFAEAREGLNGIEAATAELPVELQRIALAEAALCAVEVRDLAEATRRLNLLESVGVPHELRPSVSILTGRLAEHLQRTDDALAAYTAAAQSHDPPAAAQGRLRAIALRQALRKITNDEAIAELETLTASWRGDDVEVEAMQMLARLYADGDRFRDAFRILRVALTAHPRSQITRKIQDEASSTFDSIFMGERGRSLSAVDALALFYDFRHLTPSGRRGDEMIRRLADRLMTMDLLTQAAELLQHQIDHRLQGAARAQVAARLAMIYLLNRKPDRALAALRMTRMNDLPSDIRSQRLLLEARALSDSGRHDLALEVIEDMSGREVMRLRADINWAARRWREAGEEIERILGERWRDKVPLDKGERADVLRAAIGYALADDVIGMERFREKFGPLFEEGSDARMFRVITAPLNARTAEFAEVAKAAMSIDTLETFLKELRARYPDAPPSASGRQGGRA